MVFRTSRVAPASRIPAERRGHLIGRYCHGCNQAFPLQRGLHTGDPIFGRDHVASTCPYEGWAFEVGASWWEPAVEVLPPPPAVAAAEVPKAGTATPTPGGTAPAASPQQGQPAPASPKG
jgi:hypothetical protein